MQAYHHGSRSTAPFVLLLSVSVSADSDKVCDVESHSHVYRNTRSMWVRVSDPIKGAVVKVKIGKKVYKKKLNGKSRKVKFKIKKPRKYGFHFKVSVLYGKKVIGEDLCDGGYWDVVMYAKKLKKGMTKRQAKYTWGTPDDVQKSSGGHTFWIYEFDDQQPGWIDFKHGKVVDWG